MSDQPSISGFHHVAIRTRDFDRSFDFYANFLGLKQSMTWGEKPARAVMLDAGGGNHIEIFERPNQGPPPEEEGAILHFALRSPDTNAILEKARAAGFQVTMEPQTVEVSNTNGALPATIPVRIAFIKGPDGEVIEFFENSVI